MIPERADQPSDAPRADASPSPDRLPPEARFTLRATAAGLSFDDVADVLRVDAETARKHARSVIRLLGGSPPPASADDATLRAALAPALARAAGEPPSRPLAIRCPDDVIAAALAAAALDAALMLPHAEHAADCPACMARLVRLRREPPPAGAAPAAASDPAGAPPLDPLFWVGVTLGVAVALAYLFLR